MLEQYFSKVTLDQEYKPFELGSTVVKHNESFPNIENASVALIGISTKTSNPSDKIRKELYSLVSQPVLENKLVDLGNISEGETPADTHNQLKTIAGELQSRGVVTILLGTSLEQGEALYQSFESAEELVEATLISSHLPLLEYQLLYRICNYEPNFLQNINALAFQSHYIPPKALDTLENLNFGHYRLGALKQNIEEAELYLRNSKVVMYDANAIKHSDTPSTSKTQPNGLTGEEACQLARYSGLSESTKCFGLFEYVPENDSNNITAKTLAQLVWYFLDGYANRTNDTPELHDEFIKYRCDIKDNQPPILFLKSKRTNRWWMQIEHPSNPTKENLQITIPCSYLDYQIAANCELPERYMNAIKRLQ